MKKLFYILAILAFACNVANAQKMPKSYSFYYIAHDKETPVGKLTEVLEEAAKYANRLSSPAIFYLANGDEPIVVKFNMEGENESDFKNLLLAELHAKDYHTPGGHKDVLNILNIINEHDFIYDGMLVPDTFFRFYVGKDFWERECNISVIAALYNILNIEHYMNDGLMFEVNSHQAEEIISHCTTISGGSKKCNLFGEQDYNGMNDKITVYEY